MGFWLKGIYSSAIDRRERLMDSSSLETIDQSSECAIKSEHFPSLMRQDFKKFRSTIPDQNLVVLLVRNFRTLKRSPIYIQENVLCVSIYIHMVSSSVSCVSNPHSQIFADDIKEQSFFSNFRFEHHHLNWRCISHVVREK
ncbi:hypothetical protein [Phaffia rhodozyma]|uniref:Uncharacterized protein n=1 Tax=Phaffia rhodozyma TaxID=264483 RepID=A0A0F7SPS1_PHARH|nr:hypothetical protein [Phaffia rhodozyma]